jgi:DNA-binding transcriptional ArsR family regulator
MEIESYESLLGGFAPVSSDQAAQAFAALGSDVRLQILRCLVRAGIKGLPVGEIQKRVGIAASTLSHHVRALVQAGVLEQQREGRSLRCVARYDVISGLAGFLISECCRDAPSPQQTKEDAA